MDTYREIALDDAAIRFRSEVVREAVSRYVPAEPFKKWFDCFVKSLDIPAYYQETCQALDLMRKQFNLRPPEFSASEEVLRQCLEKTSGLQPKIIRYALPLSQQLRQAYEYPDVLLTLGIFVASHKSFLSAVQHRLEEAYFQQQITADEWHNAQYVFEQPLRQFHEFAAFSTLLPLIMFKRSELAYATPEASHNPLVLNTQAITEGWKLFMEQRMLRTDFDTGERMICPANRHLRHIMDEHMLEQAHTFVTSHQHLPAVRRLQDYGRKAAISGAYHKKSNYMYYLGKAILDSRDARGGRGLWLPKDN